MMASRPNSNDRQAGIASQSSRRREKARISEKENEDVDEMSSPRTPVIYEIVRRLGDEEMERPITSLWWSGVAAGLSISFSLLAQAILETHLPDIRQIDFNGGGGADFTPLLERADRYRPDIAVVLTDLEGPARFQPNWPVIWAVLKNNSLAVPPFGQRLALAY
jgi:hypothetical protein